MFTFLRIPSVKFYNFPIITNDILNLFIPELAYQQYNQIQTSVAYLTFILNHNIVTQF